MKTTRDFKIRPKYVRSALEWLIKNNVLYRDVVLVDRDEDDFDLMHLFVSSNNKIPINAIHLSNIIPSIRSITSSK